ncbi:MAG TPA: hypothetical protein VMW43_10415 [Bacteroidota bacterium]|nr:hypothetical protein [Bacteroidota bacterium]
MRTHPQIFLAVLLLLVSGCPAPEAVRKEAPPPSPAGKTPSAPEMSFILGTLDLSGYHGRIEDSSIAAFAKTVQGEKIDILAVEGITRYPGVATRTDFVDRFAAAAGMRTAFGETITLNNRQGGNAVFSLFPIDSLVNTHYTEMDGIGFEAVLQAVIDCGLRDVVVASTHLPEKPGVAEETSALGTISVFATIYPRTPVIVSGNLPHTAVMNPPAAFVPLPVRHPDAPSLWYTRDSSLTVRDARSEKTVFGRLLIVDFDLRRARTP